MSVQSLTYYTVICDYPGCGVSADEDSDYSAWGTRGTAYESAIASDWKTSEATGGKDFCPEHWPDDEDEAEELPAPDNADPTIQTDTLPIDGL